MRLHPGRFFPRSFQPNSVARRGHLQILTLLAVSLLSSSTLWGAITSVQTTSSGGNTNLTSITFDDGRGTVPLSELIGVELFHFRATTPDYPNNLPTAISPVGMPLPGYELPDPPPGSRHTLLEDPVLNKGITTVIAVDPHLPGEEFKPTALGLGVKFKTPLINGPGDDVVFFDFANVSDFLHESFYVSALIGSTDVYSTVTSAPLEITDYMVTLNVDPAFTYGQDPPLLTLEDFETKPLKFRIPPVPANVAAVSFDLSDLLIPEGDAVIGLFFNSKPGIDPSTQRGYGHIDPVFIAGLHPLVVPEPGTGVMLLGALAAVAARRLRRRRT